MPSKDDIVVIAPGLEQRTAKSGKQRYTVKIGAEPVYVNLSPKELGKDLAKAMAHTLSEKVKAIAATAAPATLKARKVAAKALLEGKSWAMKRYIGGRTNNGPPGQSDRLFNDSGRFANGIGATAGDNSWRVNVPANRLSGDAATVSKIWTRLVELVPEFADVKLLFSSNDMLNAQKKMKERLVQKGPMKKESGLGELVEAAVSIFEKIDSMLGAA